MVRIKARVFVSVIHFHFSLLCAGKDGAYQSGALSILMESTLTINIRQGWEWLTVVNTPNCYSSKE